MFGLGFKLPPE